MPACDFHILYELDYTRLQESLLCQDRVVSPFGWEILPFRPLAHAFKAKGSREVPLTAVCQTALFHRGVRLTHVVDVLGVICEVLPELGDTRL